MGFFLDDSSCSSATMTDMSCSNMSVSLRHSSIFGSTRRGGGAAPGAPAAAAAPNGSSKQKFKLGWDDSGLSITKKNKKAAGGAGGPKGFKFSWEDSCVSSVATIDWNADSDSDDESDLDGSSTSHFLDNYSYNNNRRKSTTVESSSLGNVLQQVDGIKAKKNKEENKENKNQTGLLGGRLDEDIDSSEEDLFLPPAAVASKKEEEAVAESIPEEKVVEEEERETTIKFVEPLVVSQVDFVQEEDAVLAIWDDEHVAEDHNQIPWDEEDYEELPWHLQPDLDEDDDLTKRVKIVLGFSSEEEDKQEEEETEEDVQNRWRYGGDQDETPALELEDQCHVDRVEALVIRFVLTLKHKRHCRLAGAL